MNVNALRASLLATSAYGNITAAPVMVQVEKLLSALARGEVEQALECCAGVFYTLHRAGFATLGDYLWYALRYEEAPYPLLVERGEVDPVLEEAAARDVETFRTLAGLDWGEVTAAIAALLGAEEAPAAQRLPRWTGEPPFTFESLTEFYRRWGAGLFAKYRAFLWEEGKLRPVEKPDCFGGEDLVGYEREREAVIANTRAMLSGKPVNNVLLYGEPGTGKSVTVKSLITIPGFEDLRLIQVQKEALGDMPELIRMLGHRRQKFILFIDDLAFDQDDRTYSVLKTILEGGLEPRPDNVAVYATSNRRHLVRQTFSDRAGDEVDRNETINEKTSLAERFGLRILYQTLTQAEYLDMAEQMARRQGIALDRETLRAGAAQFEVRHPGKTPRTARQYIASLHT